MQWRGPAGVERAECDFTGQSSDTRRLVVAISLSGSAVSFSLTAWEESARTRTHAHTDTHSSEDSSLEKIQGRGHIHFAIWKKQAELLRVADGSSDTNFI